MTEAGRLLVLGLLITRHVGHVVLVMVIILISNVNKLSDKSLILLFYMHHFFNQIYYFHLNYARSSYIASDNHSEAYLRAYCTEEEPGPKNPCPVSESTANEVLLSLA